MNPLRTQDHPNNYHLLVDQGLTKVMFFCNYDHITFKTISALRKRRIGFGITLNTKATPPPPSPEKDNSELIKLYFNFSVDWDEINFDHGDIITNVEKLNHSWWRGVGPNGGNGLFPANYVEEI